MGRRGRRAGDGGQDADNAAVAAVAGPAGGRGAHRAHRGRRRHADGRRGREGAPPAARDAVGAHHPDVPQRVDRGAAGLPLGARRGALDGRGRGPSGDRGADPGQRLAAAAGGPGARCGAPAPGGHHRVPARRDVRRECGRAGRGLEPRHGGPDGRAEGGHARAGRQGVCRRAVRRCGARPGGPDPGRRRARRADHSPRGRHPRRHPVRRAAPGDPAQGRGRPRLDDGGAAEGPRRPRRGRDRVAARHHRPQAGRAGAEAERGARAPAERAPRAPRAVGDGRVAHDERRPARERGALPPHHREPGRKVHLLLARHRDELHLR